MVSPGALEGIRVLGVEHFISGPFCTQILADQGADVIKVESPHYDQRNGYFHTLNRNKRSVVLDLRTPFGQQAMHELVKTADVLITNFAAAVPAKLGFGYDQLREINPRLVYVHITGFGRNTPYQDRPAFDGVIQAMSGLMHLTGEPDGPPMLAGIFVPDHLTGLYAALATSFALQRRALTGEGSFTDLAMLDCLMSFQASSFQEVLNWGESPATDRQPGAWLVRQYL
jgi:crotonobetainyl-CoA:carnitine CoA-transferase CaiB-like acyl-CoA transferase